MKNNECRDYFCNFCNYLALLLFVLAITYFKLAFTAPEPYFSENKSKTVLLTLLTFLQSGQAFQIFVLFKSTRFLLRIVEEIAERTIPFIIFALATTIAVALLFTAAIPDHALNDATYSNFLLHLYTLNFDDFSSHRYSAVNLAIMTLVVLIVALVFLNILIGIIGDAFERAKEEEGRQDFQDMAYLISEYEIIARTLVCNCIRRRAVWKLIYVA